MTFEPVGSNQGRSSEKSLPCGLKKKIDIVLHELVLHANIQHFVLVFDFRISRQIQTMECSAKSPLRKIKSLQDSEGSTLDEDLEKTRKQKQRCDMALKYFAFTQRRSSLGQPYNLKNAHHVTFSFQNSWIFSIYWLFFYSWPGMKGC